MGEVDSFKLGEVSAEEERKSRRELAIQAFINPSTPYTLAVRSEVERQINRLSARMTEQEDIALEEAERRVVDMIISAKESGLIQPIE